VFAVTQVSTLQRHSLTWRGFGRAMLVLALIWWAWSAFVWVSNAHDPDAVTFRVSLLAAGALIFIAGLAVPQAYGRDGALFVATYAAVRVLHLALYADAARRGNASMRSIAGFSANVAAGIALLVVGGVAATGTLRVTLWVAAAAIDYAGPGWVARERLRSLQRVAVVHFAERYGLFIIICLGESIVAIGFGADAARLTAATIAAVSFTLLVTLGLWWTYFDRAAARAVERLRSHLDPVVAASDSYSYLHLLLVAGIIVFAVGARDAVGHGAAALPGAARLALCGGVALYLVGHAAFRLRLLGEVSWPKLAAAAGCLVVAAAGGPIASWALAALLAGVLAVLVTYEAVSEREPL
jgi:low temperature requirement protein LtrA